MKRRWFFMLPAILFTAISVLYAQAKRPLIGGACEYEDIAGSCRIVSVSKTDESIRQEEVIGGAGYQGYGVKFEFILAQEQEGYSIEKQEKIGNILKKKNTLRLANSWYPGEGFLEKYGIKEGKLFNCSLRLITQGTCTPYLFTFPGINTTDYFETKR